MNRQLRFTNENYPERSDASSGVEAWRCRGCHRRVRGHSGSGSHCGPVVVLRRSSPSPYWWQTLSLAMQELPQGLPVVQCGALVPPPLRQVLINCLRASPLMPLACVLQSFIRCCCEVSCAPAGAVSTISVAMVTIYFHISRPPSNIGHQHT